MQTNIMVILVFVHTNILRCIQSESDLDVEREKVAELRKRFDDTITGLHELGRENQTLQVSLVLLYCMYICLIVCTMFL